MNVQHHQCIKSVCQAEPKCATSDLRGAFFRFFSRTFSKRNDGLSTIEHTISMVTEKKYRMMRMLHRCLGTANLPQDAAQNAAKF